MLRTKDIRRQFEMLLALEKFTSVNREGSMTSLVGSTTIEIVGESFIADQPAIFGDPNEDYIKREEEWYYSLSLSIDTIPGGAPSAWKAVADKQGRINSNYGWCLFSPKNVYASHLWTTIPGDSPDGPTYYDGVWDEPLTMGGRPLNQYNLALEELIKNPESRRAICIYTRPSMWIDYNHNGRSDFMCTNTVQYLIRDGQLDAVVQMRSNDAVWGYKNDRAWQRHVLEKMAKDLGVPAGKLIWNAGSLHVYQRHYHLVDPSWNKPRAAAAGYAGDPPGTVGGTDEGGRARPT